MMGVPLLVVAVFGLLVAFGVWRRFGPIQWIWLLFGTAILMVVLWVLLVLFVVEPEMRRMAPGPG